MKKWLSLGIYTGVACFALCVTAFSPLCALDGGDDASATGGGVVEKKNCLRGPRGHRGHEGDRGHRGQAGMTGAVGPTGPIGSTGATGSIGATGASGPAGPVSIGVAQSFNYGSTGPIQNIGADLSGPMEATLTTVALNEAALGTSGDLSFTPGTDSYFTINTAGNYYIVYGLTGLPNFYLAGAIIVETTTMWLCVEQTPFSGPPAVQLGAVPLSYTLSRTPAGPQALVSACGQMQAHLNHGDQVRLRVFVRIGATDGAVLTLQPNQIVSGTNNLNNGGTLSLIRMP